MKNHDHRELTEEEKKLVDEACEVCLETGYKCHPSDKHVVERMIKYGYRKSNTQE